MRLRGFRKGGEGRDGAEGVDADMLNHQWIQMVHLGELGQWKEHKGSNGIIVSA